MAPDLTCLKSEMTATTVITPTTAKYRRWHRHLHLAPIRRVVPLTSARPSTAGGTQDLVAAAQAAMNEAVDRFASYADGGVPAFGGECAVWWVGYIQPWRDGDPQYMDSSTLLLMCLHLHLLPLPPEPIPRIEPVGSPIEWGATLTPSGAGGAANPDTAGPGRTRQSMRTPGDGSARLRLLLTLLGVRPHAQASGLFVLRGEGVRAWVCPFQAQVVRFWRVNVVAASSGQRIHDGMSPTGGDGGTQCTSCKTASYYVAMET